MYKPGDRIIYGSHGVCEILEIELKRIDRKNIEYYILAPIGNQGGRFFIPTQNPQALSKLSPLPKIEQLKEFLLLESDGIDVWIEDENTRKQKYKEVIASGDFTNLIRWVRSLHIHKRMLFDCGKKFHQADENFLRDAEKILTTVFAVVLEITEDAVTPYVKDLIANH